MRQEILANLALVLKSSRLTMVGMGRREISETHGLLPHDLQAAKVCLEHSAFHQGCLHQGSFFFSLCPRTLCWPHLAFHSVGWVGSLTLLKLP